MSHKPKRIRVHRNKQPYLLDVAPMNPNDDQDIKKRLRKRKPSHRFIDCPEIPRTTKIRKIIYGNEDPEDPEDEDPEDEEPEDEDPEDEDPEMPEDEEVKPEDPEDEDPEIPEDEKQRLLEEIQKHDPALIGCLNEVQKYIKDNSPNPIEILKSNLLIEDKARLTQMFEVLIELPQPSQEYLDYQKNLIHEFELAKRRYGDFLELPEVVKVNYIQERKRLLAMTSALPLDYQIISLDAADDIKGVIFREYMRYRNLGLADDEKPKLERWMETVLSLPYRRYKQLPDNRTKFLLQMKSILDREMYGLDTVKEQLLVFANARLSNPQMKECTLGLIGDPGTGKTMIANLLATCLSLPFSQISCGGITEADALKGYAYTYIGSRPGEIVNSMIEMKCNNGVIFFDEFEKIAGTSSITSMLLHVLDPVQNSRYQDSYIGKDIRINLSGVWFVLSMNALPQDSALRDRIFTVHIDGYNSREKLEIAKRHLIPKAFANMKVDPQTIIIPDHTLSALIAKVSPLTCKGVRVLKHAIHEIITKVHFLQQSDIPVSFTLKNVKTPYTIQADDLNRLLISPPEPSYRSMYT